MKRILSVVLSVALLVTGIGYTFNGALKTSAESDTLLLSNTTAKGDYMVLANNSVSDKILAYNDREVTSMNEFIWEFEYSRGQYTGRTAFAFHVDDTSTTTTGYWNINKLFCVTVYGNSGANNFEVAEGIVIQAPNAADGKIKAVEYDTSQRPYKPTVGYAEFSDEIKEDLRNGVFYTVKIMYLNDTVSVVMYRSSDGKNLVSCSYRLTFQLDDAPTAGDFSIINASNPARIKNMTVKSIDTVWSSGEASAENADWLTDDTSAVSYNTTKDALLLGNNKYADRLLEYNGANTTSMENFVWEFDYKRGQMNGRTSFAFHIGDASTTTTGYWNKKNLLTVTIIGNQKAPTNKYEVQNGIVIQAPNGATGEIKAVEYDTSVTPWVPTAGYTEFGTTTVNDLKSGDANGFYKVQIAYIDGVITASMYRSSDGKNLASVSYKLRTDHLEYVPSAGDFSIINAGNPAYINNMTISSFNALGEKLPEDGVYYSEDFENGFTESGTTIDIRTTPKEPEKTGVMEDAYGNSYLQMTHDYSHANGSDGWTTFQITPNKKYEDFTLNFKVKLDPELNPKFSADWHFMLVGFRSQSGIVKANILQIAGKGADFSVTDNSDAQNVKDYTNNRIAYADNDSTNGKTFDLPNGFAKAGLSPDGVWHKVTLKVEGWTYKYYLDGVLMMEVEDPEKLYEKGIIHITCRSLNVQLDDVEVLTTDAEITPYEPEQKETGLLYENDFQKEGDDSRIKVIRGTNYGIVTDGDKKYFHIDYEPDASNAANGPVNISFGPVGVKNFTLNMHVRITKEVSDKWHSVIPMGRTNGGLSVQGRLFTKGSYLAVQDDTVVNEISRTGPAAENHSSPNPCHDKAYGISVLEWHKISLVCDEWNYTLYVDGKKILEGVDEYQLTKWGGFALRTQGVSLDIDNIRIWGTPHYDLSFTEEVPVGTLYENNFETESLDGIKFIYYDDDKTAVKAEEDGNKFLRAYPNLDVKEDGVTKVVTGNGNLLFSFGPPNTMDFELTYRLRMKSNTNENQGSTIVGIHSDPSTPKWNTYWFNILARGTSMSLKNTSKKLGIDNLIATTGKNRQGGTQYMPSDNRSYGIRPDGKWHDIKVVSKGYTFSLYVDGQEYLTVTDKDKTFYKGYTVIGSNGCIIDVDDIKLTNK